MTRCILALSILFLTLSAARAEIVVGIAGPMTGSLASLGEQMRQGAEMAVADINAKGGVLGQKLKLAQGDDACDPKQAVAVANRLVNQGAVFVSGHFCSGSSIPASEVYSEENVLQISPGSTNPIFTDRKLSNVFRVCGRDDQQGAIAAAFITKNYNGRHIAIVHDKTAYGKGLADAVRDSLKGKNVKEVLYEAITPGERDYSALVSKLKAAKADILFFGGYHQEAGLIVRQMRDQDVNAPLMGGDALITKEFWDITGKSGAGTLLTFNPDPRLLPEAKAVVERFKAKNIKPEGYTLYTYATFQVFAQAAAQAGGTKLNQIEPILRKASFNTVLGKLSFDAKGDVQAPGYIVYEWRDGEYRPLKDKGA